MIVLFVLRLSRVTAASMAAVGPDEHLLAFGPGIASGSAA
jgi:hypothetical protein